MKKMMILWAFSLMTVTACSSETERQEPTETEQQTNKDQTMEQTNGNQTYLTLNNGVQMPQFGLGVYSIPAGEVTYNSVMTALKAGYRHIDTAHAYHNERSVGQAVKDSGISRDSIWITSKLWPNEYGEGKTLAAIDRMLGRLGLERQGSRHRHFELRRDGLHLELARRDSPHQTADCADRVPPLCPASPLARDGSQARHQN